MRLLLLGVLSSVLMSGCAANLPRERKVKKRIASEAINLADVNFKDAETGQTVNVQNYMQLNNLNYLLLMFGSVGCTKCNEKALNLSENYLHKHDLFLNHEQRGFEMIGVNTDTGSNYTKFLSIVEDPQQREKRGYEFIRWSDPVGEVMMKYLVGKEQEKFGVPFTILLDRKGALLRYGNKDHYTVEELVDNVVRVMNGEDARKPGGKEPPVVTPPPKFDIPGLSFVDVARLDGISASACNGAITPLKSYLRTYDAVVVQASKDACAVGSDCAANLAQLAQVESVCSAAGKSCKAINLSAKPDTATCATAGVDVRVGGKEFFDSFATHFNWRYDPVTDEYGIPVGLKPVGGPLTFIFQSNGTLVQSWEGALPAADSVETILKGSMNERAVGIDYPVYAGPLGNTDLAKLRKNATYTVVAAFDRYCGSCIDELALWSKAGQLAEYCSKSNGFCRALALEGELPRDMSAQGIKGFFDEIYQEHFEPAKITIPLLIDKTSFGDNYSRLFSSYVTPLLPQWQGMYGALIFDQEGKIIASFRTPDEVHEPDHVLEFMKKLRQRK